MLMCFLPNLSFSNLLLCCNTVGGRKEEHLACKTVNSRLLTADSDDLTRTRCTYTRAPVFCIVSIDCAHLFQ